MKARSLGTSQSVTAWASEATTSRGGPKGARASKRSEAGARRRSTPERRAMRVPRRILISARERRSWKSRQRASSVARAAATSGGSSWRGGIPAQPPDRARAPSSRPASLLLLGLGTVTALGPEGLVARLVELLLDRPGDAAVDLPLERALPGGDGVVGAAGLDVRVGQVVEDDRVFLGEGDGALQLRERVGVAALLVVGPAQAVDEVAVLGVEVERALDELHGLGQVLAALGVHVADVVVGLGVLGVEHEHAAEGRHGVVEAPLLLVHDARLEDQVLVVAVDAEPFLERGQRAVVLLGPEVRGAQVQEELAPLGLDVDGFLQEPDGLVVALGAAVEERELDAGVDRARIGGQDLLELDLRLCVLAGIHERRGEEVARPEVGGLDRGGVAEGRHGTIPLLLLVVNRAELDPDARVTRRGLRQRLDLLLRLLEAAEPDQHVAQPLDEGDIFRVGLQRLPVDLESLFGLLAVLVHES